MPETNYIADPAGHFSFIDFGDTEAGQNSGSGSGGVVLRGSHLLVWQMP